MSSSLLLTLFLVVGSVVTLWCSIKDYNWFFEWGGVPGIFIKAVGRPFARLCYILFSIVMLVWGLARVIDPPPVIPPDFIYEFGEPAGIDLTSTKEAERRLRSLDGIIKDLEVDELGWVSFWMKIPSAHDHYEAAVASASAGPDFSEGFALSQISYGGRYYDGRIIYFDQSLRSCDNVLFSNTPLKSATFVMVINSEEASMKNGVTDGIVVSFLRSGTDAYKGITG